jgi:NTP pyrophosphatase (non-canonical NTP hydrolase)
MKAEPRSFSDYQSAAARTMNAALSPDERLIDAAAGLAEEAGEVLGMVRKHLYRSRPLDSDALMEELGDALWCIAAVASTTGLSLESIAVANLEKLRRRYPLEP